MILPPILGPLSAMNALRIHRDDTLVYARLDDGGKNVITLEIAQALLALIRDTGPSSTLILEGNDAALSVGLDTETVLSGGPEGAALFSTMGEVLTGLYLGPVRSVVVTTGHATAAGAMLLLCADRRIGYGAGGKVGLSEVRVGLDVPRPTQQLVKDRIAVPHQFAATALATLYRHEQAAQIGFLDQHCADRDTAMAMARTEAAQLSALPQEAYLKTKQAMRSAFAELR